MPEARSFTDRCASKEDTLFCSRSGRDWNEPAFPSNLIRFTQLFRPLDFFLPVPSSSWWIYSIILEAITLLYYRSSSSSSCASFLRSSLVYMYVTRPSGPPNWNRRCDHRWNFFSVLKGLTEEENTNLEQVHFNTPIKVIVGRDVFLSILVKVSRYSGRGEQDKVNSNLKPSVIQGHFIWKILFHSIKKWSLIVLPSQRARRRILSWRWKKKFNAQKWKRRPG